MSEQDYLMINDKLKTIIDLLLKKQKNNGW